MKNSKNILLIIGKVHYTSSQGVRYHNLINNFGDNYEIKVLTPYPGKFLNKDLPVNSTGGNLNKIKKAFKWIYKHFIERFIFPDRFIFKISEYKSLIYKAFLTKPYDYVILGMTPFSLYKLAPFIRKTNPAICIICDLSDPFIKNGANNYWFPFWKWRIKNYEAKYLTYINKLVVLNPAVKSLYTNTYKSFNSENIFVVEQGIPFEALLKRNTEEKKNANDKKVRLLYAGGLYPKFREPFELFKAIENINNHKLELDIYGNINPAFFPADNRKILYKGILTQSGLFEEYSNSQILVFIDNSHGIQVPGKLFELISQNKPVLFIYSNPDSPSMIYLKDSTNVFPVKNEASEIQSGIEKILTMDLYSFVGTDVSNYTWDRLAEKYSEIIEKLND